MTKFGPVFRTGHIRSTYGMQCLGMIGLREIIINEATANLRKQLQASTQIDNFEHSLWN